MLKKVAEHVKTLCSVGILLSIECHGSSCSDFVFWRIRIDVGDKSIVFTGDTDNKTHSLEPFAHHADILIADYVIPEAADKIAKTLQIQPSIIAALAQKSDAPFIR